MAALLALASALAFGTGDFLGGLAARRVAAATVVLWSHALGLALLLACAPLAGGEASVSSLLIGAASGVAGGIGVALLYGALAGGAMNVAAPITALLSAAVPVVAGVLTGDRPRLAAAAGVVLALLAIGLVARPAADDGVRTYDRRVVAMALGAGLGFGLFFVILSAAGDGSGLWPLVGARLASTALFATLAASGRVDGRLPAGGARTLVGGAGVLDAVANVAFLLAVRQGLLSIVSVLAALYPAATVALARAVLGERTSAVQRVGLALAALAVVLVAA